MLYALMKMLASSCRTHPPALSEGGRAGSCGKAKSIFPYLTALLFLSHPVQTETVNYISCRSDLMVTLFMGLGVIQYIRKRYFISLICYVIALLTKETALCLVFLVLAYEVIYERIDITYIKKVFRYKNELR